MNNYRQEQKKNYPLSVLGFQDKIKRTGMWSLPGSKVIKKTDPTACRASFSSKNSTRWFLKDLISLSRVCWWILAHSFQHCFRSLRFLLSSHSISFRFRFWTLTGLLRYLESFLSEQFCCCLASVLGTIGLLDLVWPKLQLSDKAIVLFGFL